MATAQELAVRDKKELVSKEEKTVPGRYYVPYADIYETNEALTVVLEMPGVEKKDLDIALENNVLRVDGRIEFSKYRGNGPALHRIQRWPLYAVVQPFRQDRPGAD